jgi:hypothetical protein
MGVLTIFGPDRVRGTGDGVISGEMAGSAYNRVRVHLNGQHFLSAFHNHEAEIQGSLPFGSTPPAERAYGHQKPRRGLYLIKYVAHLSSLL